MENNTINKNTKCGQKGKRVIQKKIYSDQMVELLPTIVVGILSIIVVMFSITKAEGIFFPQDEFGYFSNAAKIVGFDWSLVKEGQARYAYGYSLLLVPLLSLCENSVIAYKTALFINALLLIIYSRVFALIVCKLLNFSTLKERNLVLISGLFYPSLLIYMNYSTAETLISLLFVTLLLSLYKSLESNFSSIKTVISTTGLALILIFCHYRTLGILVSLVLTIFLYIYKKKLGKNISKISFTILSLCFSLFVITLLFLCKYFGYFRLSELFSVSSIMHFIVIFIGQIYYLSVATFGFGLIGLYYVIKQIRNDNSKYFYSFILISLISTMLICSYFFSSGLRIDQLVYGRYFEFFLPLFTSLGVYSFIKEIGCDKSSSKVQNQSFFYLPSYLSKCAFIFIVPMFCAIVLYSYVRITKLSEYVPNYIPGISWLFKSKFPGNLTFFIFPVFSSLCIFLIVFIIFSSLGQRTVSVFLISLVFLFASSRVINSQIHDFHKIDSKDKILSEKATELMDSGQTMVFLNSPYNDYVNLMQFWLYDRPIRLENIYDSVNDIIINFGDSFLLIYEDNEFAPGLYKHYNYSLESEHFILFYN